MYRKHDTMKRPLLPVLVDLSEKHVLFLPEGGSDEEALLVLNALFPCTPHLSVFAPSVPDSLRKLCGKMQIAMKEKAYSREDLYGADVVICASRSPQRTDEVHAACRTLGIRLCLLSEPERSDFLLKLSENDSARQESGGSRRSVTIYTDGSARGNPDGPGGYGAIIEYTDPKGNLHTRELSQGYEKTTNNRMELMGAIASLEALTEPCDVTLHSDSRYLVSAFNEHWIDGWIRKKWMRTGSEAVKNTDLWKRLLRAAGPHRITWIWVKGHSGHKQNERCDALATQAADSGNLIPDPGR